jgi:hypothetical protein
MLRTGDFRSATSAMADKLKPYGVIRIHSLSLLNSAFVGEIQTSRPLQQHVVSLHQHLISARIAMTCAETAATPT